MSTLYYRWLAVFICLNIASCQIDYNQKAVDGFLSYYKQKGNHQRPEAIMLLDEMGCQGCNLKFKDFILNGGFLNNNRVLICNRGKGSKLNLSMISSFLYANVIEDVKQDLSKTDLSFGSYFVMLDTMHNIDSIIPINAIEIEDKLNFIKARYSKI